MRRRFLIAAAITALAAVPTLGASNVTGTWHGAISFDIKQIPKPKTPQEKAQTDQAIAMLKKLSLTLTLRADHTCHMVSKGMPSADHTLDGKWALKGIVVTMTIIKEDGKTGPNGKTKTETLSVSKDGKTLSMGLGATKGAALLFHR